MSQPTKPLNLTPLELNILSEIIEHDTRNGSYNSLTLAGMIVLKNIQQKINNVLPAELKKERK